MSYFNLKYLILANKKIFWYLHIHTHLLLLFAVNLERYPFYTHCRWIVPFEDFVLFLYLYLYDLRTLYEGPEIQNGKYSFFDNMFSETQIFKYVALLPLSFTLEVALIESFPPSSEQSSFNAGNPTTALWLWGFGRLVEYKDLCILIQYSVDANKGLIWIVNGAVGSKICRRVSGPKFWPKGEEREGDWSLDKICQFSMRAAWCYCTPTNLPKARVSNFLLKPATHWQDLWIICARCFYQTDLFQWPVSILNPAHTVITLL